jgi:hypothetical protein
LWVSTKKVKKIWQTTGPKTQTKQHTNTNLIHMSLS